MNPLYIDFEQIFTTANEKIFLLKEIPFTILNLQHRTIFSNQEDQLVEDDLLKKYVVNNVTLFYFKVSLELETSFLEKVSQLSKTYANNFNISHQIKSQQIISQDIDKIIEKGLTSSLEMKDVIEEWLFCIRSFIQFKEASLYLCQELGSLTLNYTFNGETGLKQCAGTLLNSPEHANEYLALKNKKIYVDQDQNIFLPLFYQEIPLGVLQANKKEVGAYLDTDFSIINKYLVALNHIIFQKHLKGNIKRSCQFNDDLKFYVSNQIYQEIIDSQSTREFKSQKKYIACLYADIRSFTSISEKLKPTTLVTLLNIYFEHMAPIIEANNGTIDKFVGDMVTAFWNAPKDVKDPELLAIQTGLKMQQVMVQKVAPYWVKEGVKHVGIGVGISSGNLLVGDIGSKSFKNYTIFGPIATEANYLESLARPAEVRVSASCYKKVKEQLPSPLKKEPHMGINGKKKEHFIFKSIDYPDYTKK